MIDLRKYRVIDLSYALHPGERKIDGRYLHGEPLFGRPYEVQEFIAFGARMHFIQGQTHSGTHVEATYKYSDTGADCASMPLESYLGDAAVCDFSGKKAGEVITPVDFQKAGVQSGDIVLAFARDNTLKPAPRFTEEAIDWLIETKIKLFGAENLDFSAGPGNADCRLLLAGIPVADALVGLDQIKKNRVFFIGLPIRMHRVTASWTRAIALEEI